MNIQQMAAHCWQVESETTPGRWYSVEQQGDLWSCTCPHCQRRGARCKHIAAVADCPTCKGRGIIKLSLLWYEADGSRSDNELPCVVCSGSGRREEAVPSDLPSQTELLDIFR